MLPRPELFFVNSIASQLASFAFTPSGRRGFGRIFFQHATLAFCIDGLCGNLL